MFDSRPDMFFEHQPHPAMLRVIDVLYQLGCWLEEQEAACDIGHGQAADEEAGLEPCASGVNFTMPEGRALSHEHDLIQTTEPNQQDDDLHEEY